MYASTAIAGAAAAALVVTLFVVRRGYRSWQPPFSVAMALVTATVATLSAIRQVVLGFGTESLAGSKGVGPAAAVILESRYPAVVAGIFLLLFAAIGFASSARAEPAPREPGEPAGLASGVLIRIVLLLSALAVLATALLLFWEMSQASWLMRTLVDGPLDFKILTRTSWEDAHGRLGLSLAGLAYLCFASMACGVVLAVLSQVAASTATPPRWFVLGNRALLSILVLVAVASLVRGAAQRTWLRRIAVTGQVPGFHPRPRSSSALFPPCGPHAANREILESSSELTEPVALSRVKPLYPEEARLARIQGVVVLEAVIAPDGRVRSACVLRTLDPRLDAAAGQAVMQWSYEPATRRSDGSAVAVYLAVRVTFRLE